MSEAREGAFEEPAGDQPIGTFHAFRYVNYRLYWIGNFFTAAAQWTQEITVSWVVYILTGSGTMVGSVNLMRGVATLCFALPAGSITDRVGRKRIIAVSQVMQATLAIALAVDLALGTIEIWHLFVYMLLASTAQTFNMPAWQTFVFDIVPRHVIPNAVALAWLAFSIARAIGTMAGGSLIEIAGPAMNFSLQATAYMAVLAAVLFVRTRPAAPGPPRKPFIRSMADGYSYAVRHPQLRVLIAMAAISPFLIIPLHASLLPIFAKVQFHGQGDTYGLLAGSIGVGGLLGGLLTASLNRVDRRGMMQLIALLIFAFSETTFAILAHLTGNLWLCLPFLVIAGAFETVYATTNRAVMQLISPDHLRGSIASMLQVTFLLMPIGSFLAGFGADHLGAPLVGATITFTAGMIGVIILVTSSELRSVRLSTLVQGGTNVEVTPTAR
jgi:MFS family permease